MQTHAPLIGLDCRFAATHSGIGRYVRELVRHLLRRDDPWSYVLFVRDMENHGIIDLPTKNNFQFSRSGPEALQGRMAIFNFQFYSFAEQFSFPRLIKRHHLSLLHSPHFNAPLFSPVPFIATIHDLTLHRFPNEASLPKRLAYRFLMGRTVRRAVRLIAVSRATADDLAATYGKDIRAKTSVIYEGVSPNFQRASEEAIRSIRARYNLPERFALYVGNAKEHKNVQTLIDACPPDLPLILVTGGKEVARLCPRANTRILGEVGEADLPALYSSASVFVSPSLTEGFNLPVIEAMACGCPVVATARGSTPEVTGNHAILVEPTVEGLRTGIERALGDAGNRDAATAHARAFSWERMAEEQALVYAQALSWTP